MRISSRVIDITLLFVRVLPVVARGLEHSSSDFTLTHRCFTGKVRSYNHSIPLCGTARFVSSVWSVRAQGQMLLRTFTGVEAGEVVAFLAPLLLWACWPRSRTSDSPWPCIKGWSFSFLILLSRVLQVQVALDLRGTWAKFLLANLIMREWEQDVTDTRQIFSPNLLRPHDLEAGDTYSCSVAPDSTSMHLLAGDQWNHRVLGQPC